MSMHPLEADFREWSKPPTTTEEQRGTNAESVVRNAIRSVDNYHEVIAWLDTHRFYLDQSQCERVNAMQKRLDSEPRDVGEIRVLRAEVRPDSRCTAEYFEPEASA